MKKQSKLVSEKQIENEVSRARDVSQWKLSRDGDLVSDENLYYIQYYKEVVMSNNKLFYISSIYMLHCGIKAGMD